MSRPDLNTEEGRAAYRRELRRVAWPIRWGGLGLIVLAAAVILAAGWLLHWRRLRMCRKDGACRHPSRLAFWLLVIASLLIVLSMAWQPYIEPWVMPRLAAMR